MSENDNTVEFKAPTPEIVAEVSIRSGEILVIEELFGDNDSHLVGQGEPRRVPIGSMLALKHGRQPVRVGIMRADLLALVESVEPDEFITLPWVDPDKRRAG